MKKFDIYSIILILFLSIFAILPLFQSGFFPMHDDTQPARVQQMAQSLRDGMFPVRWVADLGYGYGYPLFNFYAPLAYYFGAFFMLVGFSALTATKIMMGFSMVFAGISMYLLAKEFWGKLGGSISGILYVYAPYHAVNLYVRGDVAELWAYAFLPLPFLAIYQLYTFVSRLLFKETEKGNIKNKIVNINNKNKKIFYWILVGSVSYAAIILSHNLSALMVTPFILVTIFYISYLLFKEKNLYAIRYVLYATCFGILLSTFYWLPVLGEMHYTNVLSQIGGKADFRDHFVCPSQLWESLWGFGGSVSGCIDGMSFRIGKLHITLTVVSFILSFFLWKKNKKYVTGVILGLLLFLVGVWLTVDSSSLLWNSISVMSFFQYPWRFLLVVSFASSFVGGSAIYFIKSYSTKVTPYLSVYAALIILLANFSLYLKLFTPQAILNKKDEAYTSTQKLRWDISRISDEYLPKGFQKPEKKEQIVTEKFIFNPTSIKIQDAEYKTDEIKVEIKSKENAKVLVRTAPYPSWKIRYREGDINYKSTNKGIVFMLPASDGTLHIYYESTILQKIANTISLISIAVLFTAIMRLSILNKK